MAAQLSLRLLGGFFLHADARPRPLPVRKAQALLEGLEKTKEYVSPAELAALYTALGEDDRAFASLEKAYAAHDVQLQYLRVDPMLDGLRPDPRFQDLLRRVGLAG